MESQSFSSLNSQFSNARRPIQRQHGISYRPQFQRRFSNYMEEPGWFNPPFHHSQEGRFNVPFNPHFHHSQEQGWFNGPFNPPFHWFNLVLIPPPFHYTQEQGWINLPFYPPFQVQAWLNIPFNPPFHEHGQINLPAACMGAPSPPITGFIPFGYTGQQHYFPNAYNCSYPFNQFSNSYHYTGDTSLQDQDISNTCKALVDQVEDYFSDANLERHRYLSSRMDSEGWVSVDLIARLQRVKPLTQDTMLILKALESSAVLEVKGSKMRRRNEWKVADGASTSTHPTPYGSPCPISSNPTTQMTSIQNLGDSKAEPAVAKSPTVGSHLNNTSIDAQEEIKLRIGSTNVPDILEKSDQKGLESTEFVKGA